MYTIKYHDTSGLCCCTQSEFSEQLDDTCTLHCLTLSTVTVSDCLQDLRDLFRVVPHELDRSDTQQTLHQLHSDQRKATPYVQEHLHFLETLPRYAGLPACCNLLPSVGKATAAQDRERCQQASSMYSTLQQATDHQLLFNLELCHHASPG